jgi:hypothetical protein
VFIDGRPVEIKPARDSAPAQPTSSEPQKH